MERINAIVLAAGSGKRMGSEVPKQYLPLGGKPVMVYSLEAFDKSAVEGIVLVVAPGEVEYCRREIVEKYHIHKVIAIVEGGAERYDSVYQGLLATECDYVLIHDCARAFLTQDVIARAIESVIAYKACVVGVPVKDTIKIADRDGYVVDTPKRSLVWSVQTPQCFAYDIVLEAYNKLQSADKTGVTDDAMVVERMLHVPVKLIEGNYDNIKVTTPEDLVLGEQILSNSKNIIKKN
ncbi:MAG: 2-C-methyl-D-erythritol 4-phosphate cytidylyltransferase [Lachnospiraceae bacterium]|nr:2-C-methyl-D-erythritol 4-phosphate cytidylyltransferase [Lachnospiraceae bacterium]